MSFVHLHNRTQYSLLDGAMSPEELARAAAAHGMSAVALTDTSNLYAGVEFYKAAKGAGVKPVFGAELWVWPPGLDQLAYHRSSQAAAREQRGAPVASLPDGGWHIALLIEDKAGYKNLCQLITTAIFDGMHHRPRVDWDLLERHREGLIALTCGRNGPLAQAEPQARADLERLAELFGPQHLYVELQDFGLPTQPAHNGTARALAAALGLQTLVSNDCRYQGPEDAVTLDLLNCIARGEGVDDPARDPLPTDQQYVKSEDEMRALFPDDGPALDRTVDVADRCNFKYQTGTYWFPATTPPDADPPRPDGVAGHAAPRADTDDNWAYFYQAFTPPRDLALSDEGAPLPPRPIGAGSINGYFEWYCRRGLAARLADMAPLPDAELAKAYDDRLEFELRVIADMGFPAYLLIVAEFINWAKDRGIPVGPGRGSAAGSVCAWALRITDIDPLRYKLLFERFLNPERVSMPDIDVDFCQDRREEVIRHVSDKYGAELVSQIITYGKLQAKAALKDVARVCGVEFTGADRIAKLVPNELGITLEASMKEERFATLVRGDSQVGRIYALARRVEGMTRQTGIHAAGVVIADRPLVEHAPLYRDGPDGGPVVQYDMKSAETIGLIKFDFLGLKTLDQLRDGVAMVERNTGERIDLARIPDDDRATFELLQKGDALGVFQVESSGMRELLTRLRPNNLEDLIALLALYRPGPLSSGMVDTFIDCKHGRKPIVYPHDDLIPVLRDTYGTIVYQEQVMQIAQVYGGYSLGQADLLRRAMGKKNADEMAKQKAGFVDGAVALGRAQKQAEDLFDLLAFFAGYGFNKSHSAAYGWVSYQTAWMKAHHRAEYMAALMSIESGNTDKVLVYLADCKRAGLEILPPDVNHSLGDFDVPRARRSQIRFGLKAVKGVGMGAVEAIIEARTEAGGAFRDLADCLERLDYRRVNKKVLENLVKCGAFDWTGHPRQALNESLADGMATAQRTQELKASGQVSLFSVMGAGAAPKLRVSDLPEWPVSRKLAFEREALGFFITGHPITAYAELVARIASGSIPDLSGMTDEKEVAIAGMVSAFRAVKTRRGSRMAFVTLEDEHGSVECVFFSDPFLRSQKALAEGQPLLVRGKLERGEDSVKVLAESAELLSEVRERSTRAVALRVDAQEVDDSRRAALIQLLRGSPGSCELTLHVRFPGRAVAVLRLPEALRVVPDDTFMQGLETLFRRPDVARLS